MWKWNKLTSGKYPLVNGPQSMFPGQWSMVHGQRSLESGHWSTVFGQQSFVNGPLSMVLGQWSFVNIPWSMVISQWSLANCPWSIEKTLKTILQECENGLLFDQELALTDAVHNYCVYNWKVECGSRPRDDTPHSTPGIE